jgi:hypothetical protein
MVASAERTGLFCSSETTVLNVPLRASRLHADTFQPPLLSHSAIFVPAKRWDAARKIGNVSGWTEMKQTLASSALQRSEREKTNACRMEDAFGGALQHRRGKTGDMSTYICRKVGKMVRLVSVHERRRKDRVVPIKDQDFGNQSFGRRPAAHGNYRFLPFPFRQAKLPGLSEDEPTSL